MTPEQQEELDKLTREIAEAAIEQNTCGFYDKDACDARFHFLVRERRRLRKQIEQGARA